MRETPTSKDYRYELIKTLFEAGKIKTFLDIFTYLPKSVVANDLGTNYNRLIRLLNEPGDWTLREMTRIANFCQVDNSVIMNLVREQYSEKEDPEPKKT